MTSSNAARATRPPERPRASSPQPRSGSGGYRAPELVAPLDVRESLARVPRHATGKGMFVARLLDELDAAGIARPTSERFVPFADYPLVRCMELNVEIARLLYPRAPEREALRRVAWRSFGIFAESLVGRVLFGALACDVMSVLRLSSVALARCTNVGTQRVEHCDPFTAILHVDDAYFFAESFGVGMVEGLFKASRRSGEVRVDMRSPTAGSFQILLDP
ncbi:MAG: DUF2378 family protein [Polyangiales bacterium]